MPEIGRQLYINPIDVSNKFSLTIFGALGVGGAIFGIAAILTRQYVYATGVLLIWAVGVVVLPIGQWILLGAPFVLVAILPSEVAWLSQVVVAFYAISIFMFVLEITTQRQIT
jgi:hypothetical protein